MQNSVLSLALLLLSGRALFVDAFSVTTRTSEPIPWLIVGGGPHGVHIASRLVEEVPGLSRSKVCIVDDEPRLLHKWKTRTAATGMTYLRSSASFHLDIREDSLRSYAKKIRSRSTDRLANGKKLFAPDYKRPQLQFFNEHCDHVVEKYGLDEARVQGTVTDVLPRDDHVQVQVKRPNGETIEVCAENIVLALGSAAPNYPEWADEEMIRAGKVRHIFDDDYSGPQLSDPDGAGDGASHRHRSIAIVGGGISAAHLALKTERAVAKAHNTDGPETKTTSGTVHMISRHELQEQQFDTHQDWMMDSYAAARSEASGGQGVPKCQRHFAKLNSFVERRNVIKKERRAGTVSASVSRGKGGLRYAIQNGNIHWHTGEINGVSEKNDGRLSLSLSSDEEVVVDHIVLATGFGAAPPGIDLINGVAQREGLELCPCGYPAPDTNLRWHERIFLAGALAELELGPSARNIAGARLASERIVAAAIATSIQGGENLLGVVSASGAVSSLAE